MRKYALHFTLLILTLSNTYAQTPISKSTADTLRTSRFFVFDNGAGRGQWTSTQQAEILARLGYGGIGYTGTEDLEERLKAFDRHAPKIFNLYVGCDLNNEPAFDHDLKKAIKRLKGTKIALWLTVQGQSENDAKAVHVVSEIADLAAASGVEVALYPHSGFYVADIKDALRIVRQVNRQNVGVTFNVCHELMAGNEAQFDALLKEALPHLSVVSINGADHTGGWDKLIQPLGRGEFDLNRFLRTLIALNYTGPIGLQCYNVPGDVAANLEHNIAEWNRIVDQLTQVDR
jgi:sugar phosphate isomerase/epimerase